jgi:hypothetical protein
MAAGVERDQREISMKLGKNRHMPPTVCLGCGQRIDGATYVGEGDSSPDPGSITVCIYCGHIQAYDESLKLRELLPEEQLIVAGDARILAIQRARALAEKMEKKGK